MAVGGSVDRASGQDPDLFRAGAGRSVITPPVGHLIAGPEHADRPSTGVADDLLARAIAIESDGRRAVVVSLDVWGLGPDLATRIREAVATSVGASSEYVWLACAGNGASPPAWRDEPAYRQYAAYLPELVAGAAMAAVSHIVPAAIGTAATRLPGTSTNVAGPAVKSDEAVFVLAIDDAEGHGIARLINYSCPATVAGAESAWTADFPGYACWAVEQGGGGQALFAQGASADIRPFDWYAGNESPSHTDRTAADVQALGLLLATQASQAANTASLRRNAPVQAAADVPKGLHAMRVGNAGFLSARSSQPARFARHIRRDLPASTVFVTANLDGRPFAIATEAEDDLQLAAVELLKSIGVS